MSNRIRRTDRGVSGEPSLFDTTLAEGTFDVLLGLKQLMSREMNGHDRYLIAAQISRLTGRDLSKDMLDKYVSSDAAYRPPADILVAFSHLIGSTRVFSYLLEPLDADVLQPEDKDLVELARLTEQRMNIDSRIMQLRSKRGLK